MKKKVILEELIKELSKLMEEYGPDMEVKIEHYLPYGKAGFDCPTINYNEDYNKIIIT